jgi:hypothetical protein
MMTTTMMMHERGKGFAVDQQVWGAVHRRNPLFADGRIGAPMQVGIWTSLTVQYKFPSILSFLPGIFSISAGFF